MNPNDLAAIVFIGVALVDVAAAQIVLPKLAKDPNMPEKTLKTLKKITYGFSTFLIAIGGIFYILQPL